MTRSFFACTALVLVLSACAPTGLDRADGSPLTPPPAGGKDILRFSNPPPASPSEIRVPTNGSQSDETEITRIRSQALQEAAQSWGSQMGYARRSWEIMGRLEARSADLSTVFDFNRVISAAPRGVGVVIPPVVSRSFDAFLTDAGGREASAADEYLTIVRPGRLAPVEPTWRDYLIFTVADPEEPPRALLPDDRIEGEKFREWFDEGWQQGVDLVDAELQSRIDRLRRDYTGMLQYRRLVAQGMMDRMVLADADFGVTVDGDEMRIGSRTVRIESDAAFQGNPRRWDIRSVSERDALIIETGEIPPLSAKLF